MRLNFSRGFRAPNLSELFSEGIHHATGRYELGDKDLSTERNLQAISLLLHFLKLPNLDLICSTITLKITYT